MPEKTSPYYRGHMVAKEALVLPDEILPGEEEAFINGVVAGILESPGLFEKINASIKNHQAQGSTPGQARSAFTP